MEVTATNQRGIKNINGVWIPETDTHLARFLNDPKTMRNGIGTYQLKKLNLAMNHVPQTRRGLALDIGGHCGLWSTWLAELFRNVIAFEPHPLHRQCFDLNMRANNRRNVELMPYALGEREGEFMLHSTINSSGDSWIAPPDSELTESQEAVPVRVCVIDRITFDSRVDFMKLDCEGFELPILRGAQRLIEENQPTIIVEQKPGRAQKYGYEQTEAVKFLTSMGMRLVGEISGDYILAW